MRVYFFEDIIEALGMITIPLMLLLWFFGVCSLISFIILEGLQYVL